MTVLFSGLEMWDMAAFAALPPACCCSDIKQVMPADPDALISCLPLLLLSVAWMQAEPDDAHTLALTLVIHAGCVSIVDPHSGASGSASSAAPAWRWVFPE
jgi:hypothetical protein